MEKVTHHSLRKRVGNAVRLAEVIRVFGKHGFADLLQRLGLYEGVPAYVLRRLRLLETPPGEPHTFASRFRSALMELGPTFVKAGQILSTRPDLIDINLCKELERLQDRVAALPFELIRPAIEESLGRRLEDVFAVFDPQPVAAASLSQVYRATLKTGEVVAVKVQRPHVRHVIEQDLSLLHTIAEWARDHLEEVAWMDPVGMVDEFERAIRRELDFGIEARVIDRFRRNYQSVETVFVPRVYHDVCSSTVLVMDWIDGIRVDAVEQFPERGCDARIIAARGCEILCRQVFEHRLFHADPHPGNILVTKNNQVAFLDYGMVGYLEQGDVYAIADLLWAVINEDMQACVDAVLLFTTNGDLDRTIALERDVADYVVFEAGEVLSGGLVGKAIERITEILRKHRLQLAPRFSLLLKALATIESTGHLLDPNLDMVPVIRPYVEKVLTDRYAPIEIARGVRRDLLRLLRLGKNIPQEIHDLLTQARQGRLRIHLDHEKLNQVAAVTDRASNRVTFGVITGAIIVGSSLLIAADKAPTLGLAGYSIAAIFGFGLLVSILRSRNY